jgi:hypothetical protein
VEGLFLANTPPHTASAGVKYDRRRIGAAFDLGWVHGFRWSDGFFKGDVPSYTTATLTGSYRLTDIATGRPSAGHSSSGGHSSAWNITGD